MLQKLASNFKNPENLYKAIILDNKTYELKFLKIDNHFAFIQESKKYKNKGIVTNFTSQSFLKIKNKDGFGNQINSTIKLIKEFKFNLVDDGNKSNYLTPPHTVDKDKIIVNELDKNIFQKMNKLKQHAYIYILENKNEQLLHSVDKIMYRQNNSLTVKEYSGEYKLSFEKNIQFLEKFEEENADYLNTDEGRDMYIILKNYIISMCDG
jgi:hypothetical protein